MRHALILLAISCMMANAEETPKDSTPPSIKPVLAAFESDAKKAYDAYQAALAKAMDKARKEMDAKLKEQTKKGDLAGANAIKAKMEEMGTADFVAGLERRLREDDALGALIGGGANPVNGAKPTVIDGWAKPFDDLMSAMKPIPIPENADARMSRLFALEAPDAGYDVGDGERIKWGNPFKCSAILIITRAKGAGADAYLDMIISVNGIALAPIKEVPSNSMIKIAFNGAVSISDIAFKYKDKLNQPSFRKIGLLP